jgi:hypothetical protein
MCIVDAEEQGDIAVIDAPNGFVQTRVKDAVKDEKDMTFVKIRGMLVDVLIGMAPHVCKSHITKDKKGVEQSLVQCQNAF